ncbi:MAG: hypothetical protein MJZ42_02085 [Bacteroidales bacterium]|nr:hypothetical protein [Bacteroidales bacterium]
MEQEQKGVFTTPLQKDSVVNIADYIYKVSESGFFVSRYDIEDVLCVESVNGEKITTISILSGNQVVINLLEDDLSCLFLLPILNNVRKRIGLPLI